jgi:DNA-binding transcriptional regulator LsrR (DeoR family)
VQQTSRDAFRNSVDSRATLKERVLRHLASKEGEGMTRRELATDLGIETASMASTVNALLKSRDVQIAPFPDTCRITGNQAQIVELADKYC